MEVMIWSSKTNWFPVSIVIASLFIKLTRVSTHANTSAPRVVHTQTHTLKKMHAK